MVEFPYLEGSVDEPAEVSQATMTALNGYIERHGIVLYYKEGDRKIFRIPIEGSVLGYFGLLEFYVGIDGAGYFMASWDIEGSIKRAFGMFGYDATGKITQMVIGENSTYLLLTEEEKGDERSDGGSDGGEPVGYGEERGGRGCGGRGGRAGGGGRVCEERADVWRGDVGDVLAGERGAELYER